MPHGSPGSAVHPTLDESMGFRVRVYGLGCHNISSQLDSAPMSDEGTVSPKQILYPKLSAHEPVT